jgi:hypothetical protein
MKVLRRLVLIKDEKVVELGQLKVVLMLKMSWAS